MPTKKPASLPEVAQRKRALRLHGTIARDIGVRIVSGRIGPGRILNGEIEASERLQVSRTAYREAVRILAAKGLVESRPKLGTRVSEPRNWHLLDPDVISWMMTHSPDAEVLSGLLELRTIVEPAASALAATRRTKAQLQALRASLDRMAHTANGSNTLQAADREFHTVLLEASGNPFLASLSSGVAAALRYKSRREAVQEHERVYEAIAARNPRAASQAMTNLIRYTLLDASSRHRKPTPSKR